LLQGDFLEQKGLVVPLLVWLFATVIYGVALFAVGDYDYLSFFYHVFLIAAAICFAVPDFSACKLSMLSASLKNELGLRIGNWRRGILLGLAFLGYVVLAVLIHGFNGLPAVNFVSFSAVVFAPVTEEIFWRGLIQQRMLKLKLDPLYVIELNALLFGAMHLPKLFYFNTLIDFIPITGLGIFFAATCYLTKNSVYYSTVQHIIENLVAS